MKVPEMKAAFEKWTKEDAAYDTEKAKASFEKQNAAWKETAKKARAAGKQAPRPPRPPAQPRLSQNHPANLYNGMIAPILPCGIRSAIWHQGRAQLARCHHQPALRETTSAAHQGLAHPLWL